MNEWIDFFIKSDKSDESLAREFESMLIQKKPDLDTIIFYNNKIKDDRSNLHQKIYKIIKEYIAQIMVAEALSSHKTENMYLN